MSSSDKLDLILFGATGFTGKFCVEHLLEKYCGDDTYKFGLAARNTDKLKVIVNSFIHKNKNAEKFELIECDVLDSKQVTSVVERTNVVITTVGPYAKYGENLITICANNGVDYVDLTGESHWVEAMIKKCETNAIKSKARIVNIAGAMCTVMDCAVYASVKKLKDDEKSEQNYLVRTMKEVPKSFGFDGGSAQTILNAYKEDGMKNFFDEKAPYSLCPTGNKYSNIQKRKGFDLPQWNSQLERYEAPVGMMGAMERMVICRSNHLLEYFYGTAPVINESVVLFKSKYYIIALLVCLFGFIIPFVLVKMSFLKPIIVKIMEWIFPESGAGPRAYCDGGILNREVMESAVFKEYAFVEGKDKKGIKVEAVTYGDYGYYNTGKLLVEEGMIFVEQRKKGIDIANGGFLTPAVAFGDELIQRLNDLKQFDIKFTQY